MSTRFLLFFSFGFLSLSGCQTAETDMCSCMEKNSANFNNKASEEVLGSPFSNTMASATAFGCAQEIMEKRNMSFTEMMTLYKNFTESDCGRKFGVDSRNVEREAEKAKQYLNSVVQPQATTLETLSPGESENITTILADTSDVSPPSVDTLDSFNFEDN